MCCTPEASSHSLTASTKLKMPIEQSLLPLPLSSVELGPRACTTHDVTRVDFGEIGGGDLALAASSELGERLLALTW